MTNRETILLPGESNQMGFQGGSVPSVTYANAGRIKVMRADLSIVPASDPLVPGFNFGVGPGMGFADEYISQKNDPTLQVCLIPLLGLHSVDFQIGTVSFTVTIKAALAARANWGPIAGMFYVQGINDVGPNDYAAWPRRVRNYFADVRMTLQSHVPIVVAGLPANWNSNPEWAQVQAWIDELPNDVQSLAVISGADLPVNSSADPNHWTAPSAVMLGRRGANALLGIS